MTASATITAYVVSDSRVDGVARVAVIREHRRGTAVEGYDVTDGAHCWFARRVYLNRDEAAQVWAGVCHDLDL